ncbi:MAG: sulfurtransferase [Magnetococcales bacterium]|nr:sulfurtransferase [Magnetococcales bacterium]
MNTLSHDSGAPFFPGLFVDMPWLEAHLSEPDLRIVQIGGEEYFPQFHIPGASLLSYRDLVTIRQGVPGMRADPAALAPLFGQQGISLDTPVLVYDLGGGMDAARAAWTLISLGHPAVALLEGGFGIWFREKRPMQATFSPRAALSLHLQPNPAWEATAAEVWAVAQGQQEALLLDTRTPQEYLGQNSREPRGHIAGARHFNWLDALCGLQDPRLLPEESLRAHFARLGLVDAQQEVMLYCETAHRASHTWVLLRHLGFNRVRLYDGSMAEWRLLGYPVVAGQLPR